MQNDNSNYFANGDKGDDFIVANDQNEDDDDDDDGDGDDITSEDCDDDANDRDDDNLSY